LEFRRDAAAFGWRKLRGRRSANYSSLSREYRGKSRCRSESDSNEVVIHQESEFEKICCFALKL
jgi:hypothetical protein